MDNENMKNGVLDAEEEFEIPDALEIPEELAARTEAEPADGTAEKEEKPKRTRRKPKAAPDATREGGESKPKRKRKTDDGEAINEKSQKSDNEAALTDTASANEPDKAEDTRGNEAALTEAVGDNESAAEESVTDNEARDAEADGGDEIVAAVDDGDAAADEADGESGEPAIPDNALSEYDSVLCDWDGFLTDENGKRIIPEDIFPDDALSQAESTLEPSAVIDLLGDPVRDDADFSVEDSLSAEISHPEDITPSEPAKPEVKDKESYDPEAPRRIDVIFDFIELLVFTLVGVLILTSFFFRHAVVEGGSMLNTLEPRDVLLISDFLYTPERGDIVVVEDYTLQNKNLRKPIVKRVIALEGDRVEVRRDAIYVNSVKLVEPYVYIDDAGFDYYDAKIDRRTIENGPLSTLDGFFINNEYYTFTVPDGEVFVLGDHRNDSTDSRDVGTVREDAILGGVIVRLYPFDKFGKIEQS